MEINLCGHKMKNPVIAASGTFGFGREYEDFYHPSLLGGISSKGLTLKPQKGNPGQRIHETPAGIMNSIGLQNPGVEEFIRTELTQMLSIDTLTLVNLGGHSIDDYMEGASRLEKTDAPIIELNISCPNVEKGGMAFGIQCIPAKEVVSAVRSVTKKTLIVKLSPNAENIAQMAAACEEAGADGISLVNTFQAMAVDVYKRKAVFERVTAGLSGPAIFPIALRMVHDAAKAVSIPVIGLGGIQRAEDAIAMIMAGATAVQVGTAQFMRPSLVPNLIEDMKRYMETQGIRSWGEIRGII